MSPRQGKRGKIPLLPNTVGKKSVNDSGPRQGHDKLYLREKMKKEEKTCLPFKYYFSVFKFLSSFLLLLH